MRYIREYLNRAWRILRDEGAISLLRVTFSYLSLRVFRLQEYYILHHYAGELNEADFLPKDFDLTFELITSNEMADDWARQTGCDFRAQILHARQQLDAGAIAFCIFAQNQLASISWVGLTQRAKDSINPQPFQVNFAQHQGCVGLGKTFPKFRGNGLMAYNWVHINNYMKEQGITMLTSVVGKDNVASYKVQARFPSIKICARGRYFRFLWWKYWKETPIPEDLELFD